MKPLGLEALNSHVRIDISGKLRRGWPVAIDSSPPGFPLSEIKLSRKRLRNPGTRRWVALRDRSIVLACPFLGGRQRLARERLKILRSREDSENREGDAEAKMEMRNNQEGTDAARTANKSRRVSVSE